MGKGKGNFLKYFLEIKFFGDRKFFFKMSKFEMVALETQKGSDKGR